MSSPRPLRPIQNEALNDLQAWFPLDRGDPSAADTFEIGLAIAGGQSAGCYLAGVLDFLFEALDCWDAARRAVQEKVPNHKVKIKVIAGASAGGLNAAIAAICSRYKFSPASHHRIEDADKNLGSPFYRAWVHDIDITNLLSTDDLRDGSAPSSVLNSDYLDGRVANYLNFTGDEIADRSWIDDPLPVKIMLSNIDGVPFDIRFNPAQANAAPHHMSLHRDHISFLRPISAPVRIPTLPDCDVLTMDNRAAKADWQRLGNAALATVAFPFALKTRIIERPTTDYEYRFAYPFAPQGLVYARPFPGEEPRQMQFAILDGGVTDNEPFGLAHTVLAGSSGKNARQGNVAKRAIILIDPFVAPQERSAEGDITLLGVVAKIWNALVAQSRFKPIDLTLAEAEDVYSRFMIAPVRRGSDGPIRGDAALASHPLNAFFGYFSKHYRHHDFMLGRRNCYNFLRDWFVLPSRHGPDAPAGESDLGNSLFAAWPQAALADPAYKSQAGMTMPHRQIIPLIGNAAQEPEPYPWPAGKFAGYCAVSEKIVARLDALYPSLRDRSLQGVIETRLGRWAAKIAANIYWKLKGRKRFLAVLERLVNEAQEKIDSG